MILVFGAGGQLGRELTLAAPVARVPLTGLTHGDADIADDMAVARAVREVAPAVVINAAAYNAVDKAEAEVAAANRANAAGPAVLAQACAAARIPLIHISTDYVFDGRKPTPYVEQDPIGPLSAYARSKAEGEKAVRRLWPHHLIVRTAWLYGVHGANFVKTMVKLAAERPDLKVVTDQTGSPTSTADLARALLAAANAIGNGVAKWGTYHFAGRGTATRLAFVERIVAAQRPFTGRAPRLDPVTSAEFPAAARRPRNSALDSSKFEAAFGVRAGDWREEVDRTVAALCAIGAPA